ncbi:hypothetical protein [Brevundimonas lenta]|uniref:Uncharacterized protein n=1 Tax=Brevundimonas lenta TaxID=424796 RepID=A0A7W6JAT7_9CAUL|nr:hypothetical protein [Brevundimonas lenta]MBB4081667.1 hypothetical protein [Brevundimonas lenta]
MTHQSPHDKSADAVHEGRPVEAQYVRGGRGGVRVLTLLVISAGLTAILLLGMWFVSQGGFARTNANIGDQAVDAQAFDKSSDAAPSTKSDAPPVTAGPVVPPTSSTPPNKPAPASPY